MKKLKVYFGAAALMLLATQCNMMPWFPVEPQPIVDPIITPIYSDGYNVDLGDTVVVPLKANGSTGFQWSWINKEACAHVDSVGFNYILDNNDPTLVGVGGLEVWKFRGLQTGTDTLKFEYRRPWSETSGPDSTKIVIIHVGPFPVICY